ncbi:MAG: response regulator, partial [Planctomycetia bacterium]|nr:response regulator [Planctomycetia bacterium]
VHLPAPSARARRPDLPHELDAVVTRMLATHPEQRYATPQEVMRALFPFLSAVPGALQPRPAVAPAVADTPGREQVLVVEDNALVRFMNHKTLNAVGLKCVEANNGAEALRRMAEKPVDLVLLDIELPDIAGTEVLRRLREQPPIPNLKIILLSGHATADQMAEILLAGADDYLTKPVSPTQLQARVKAALRLKEAQDRSDVLTREVLAANAELERSLCHRDSDLYHARNALVLSLAKLVEQRAAETHRHLLRLQRYCRSLAEAARSTALASQLDGDFLAMLEVCVPLHDIGKVSLPDHILQKAGKLDPEERIIMQTHTTLGADTLTDIAREHGSGLAFLRMAIDVVRHHHERYDGTGYPDRLAGAAIPLAARLLTVADVYDALRSRRTYRPALAHTAAVQLMTDACQGQFDPLLLQVFPEVATRWDAIFQELKD